MITGILRSRIAIYVPTTIHINQPADTTKYVRLTQAQFSGWFGAQTTTECSGGYTTFMGEGINEKIYKVESFCNTEQLVDHFPDVIALGDQLCRELDQESIAGEVNNKMFFMDGA